MMRESVKNYYREKVISMSNTDWLEWQKKVVYEEYIKPYLDDAYDKENEKKDPAKEEVYANQVSEK